MSRICESARRDPTENGILRLENGMFRIFCLVDGRNKWVADVASLALAQQLHDAVLGIDAAADELLTHNTDKTLASPDFYVRKATLLAAAATDPAVSRVKNPKNPSLMPVEVSVYKHMHEGAYHTLNKAMPSEKAGHSAPFEGRCSLTRPSDHAAEGCVSHSSRTQHSPDSREKAVRGAVLHSCLAETVAASSQDSDHQPAWFEDQDLEAGISILDMDAAASLLQSVHMAENRVGLLTPFICQQKSFISDMMTLIFAHLIGDEHRGGVPEPLMNVDERAPAFAGCYSAPQLCQLNLQQCNSLSDFLHLCAADTARQNQNACSTDSSQMVENTCPQPHDPDEDHAKPREDVHVTSQTVSIAKPSRIFQPVSGLPDNPAFADWSWLTEKGQMPGEAGQTALLLLHAQTTLQAVGLQSLCIDNLCSSRQSWQAFCADLWQVMIRTHAPSVLCGAPHAFHLDCASLPTQVTASIRLQHFLQSSHWQRAVVGIALGCDGSTLDLFLRRQPLSLGNAITITQHVTEFLLCSHMQQNAKFRIPPKKRPSSMNKGRQGPSRSLTFHATAISNTPSRTARSKSAASKTAVARRKATLHRPTRPKRGQKKERKQARNKRSRPRTDAARSAAKAKTRAAASQTKRLQLAIKQQQSAYNAIFSKAVKMSTNSVFLPRKTIADSESDATCCDMDNCGICGSNHYSEDNPAVVCKGGCSLAHLQCWQWAGYKVNSPNEFTCAICTKANEDDAIAISAETEGRNVIFNRNVQRPRLNATCALCRTAQAGLPMIWSSVLASDDSEQSHPQQGHAGSTSKEDQQTSFLDEPTASLLECYTSTPSCCIKLQRSGSSTEYLLPVHAVCALAHRGVIWQGQLNSDQKHAIAVNAASGGAEVEALCTQADLPICTAVVALQHRAKKEESHEQRCTVCRGQFLPPESSRASRNKVPNYHFSCALRGGQLIKCRCETLSRKAIPEPGFMIVKPNLCNPTMANFSTCQLDTLLNTKAVCAGSERTLKSIVRSHATSNIEASDLEKVWTFRLIPNLISFVDRTRVVVHPTHANTCAGFVVPCGIFQGTPDFPCMYMSTIPALCGVPLGIAYDNMDTISSTILHLAAVGFADCVNAWIAMPDGEVGKEKHEQQLKQNRIRQSALNTTIAAYILQRCFPQALVSILQQAAANQKVAKTWQWPELFSKELGKAEDLIETAAKNALQHAACSPTSISTGSTFVEQAKYIDTCAQSIALLPPSDRQDVLEFCVRAFFIQHEARILHLTHRFRGVAQQGQILRIERASQTAQEWHAALCPETRYPPHESTKFPIASAGSCNCHPKATSLARKFLVCLKLPETLPDPEKTASTDASSSSASLRDPPLQNVALLCTQVPPPPPKSKLARQPVPIELPSFDKAIFDRQCTQLEQHSQHDPAELTLPPSPTSKSKEESARSAPTSTSKLTEGISSSISCQVDHEAVTPPGAARALRAGPRRGTKRQQRAPPEAPTSPKKDPRGSITVLTSNKAPRRHSIQADAASTSRGSQKSGVTSKPSRPGQLGLPASSTAEKATSPARTRRSQRHSTASHDLACLF